MRDDMPRPTKRAASRRQVYRAAKRLLIREARRVWRGPVHAIKRRVRVYLRGKSQAYLLKLLARPAMALAVVASLAVGAPAYAADPIELSDVEAGLGGIVINGFETSGLTGLSVAGAGDVNGDGIADVVMGTHWADPGGIYRAGEAYVIFGKSTTNAINLSDVVAGTGGFVISGGEENDRIGRSVSGGGDVNGDGLDDVIIGAYGAGIGGRAYVVFGKASTAAVDVSDVAAGTGGFVIHSVGGLDLCGRSVADAGDVNGDGLADFIVGAPEADGGENYSGVSYVVFGKADTAAVNLSDVVAGSGGFVINGIDRQDDSGRSVSGAGDVNGDGLADVIVGAPEADIGGNNFVGESYVVFGKADTAAVNLSDVVAGFGGFVINGINALDRSGMVVSGAGDVNGDGLPDVLVAAPSAAPNGIHLAGESYVVFGKANTSAVNLADVVGGSGGFVINGIDVLDKSGSSVSSVGDINSDALADVIIGAPSADPGGTSEAGESYVVFGKTSTDAVNLADVVSGSGGFVINGINENDSAGVSVSGVGDMNGDGIPDYIIGAPGGDALGIDNAGKTYVVFGTPPGPIPVGGTSGYALLSLLLAAAGSLALWRLSKRGRRRARSLE